MNTKLENGVQIVLKMKEGEIRGIFDDEQIEIMTDSLDAIYTPQEATIIEEEALRRMFPVRTRSV